MGLNQVKMPQVWKLDWLGVRLASSDARFREGMLDA